MSSRIQNPRPCVAIARSSPFTIRSRTDVAGMFRRSGCQSSPSLKLTRSEEHTSELQSRLHLVCRLLLVKKFMRASIKMIGVSNLQSFIASMTQKLTLSDISDESKNYLDKAGITTACLRIKSKWTAGGK